MTKILICARLLVLISGTASSFCSQCWAAEAMESSALRVEISTSPYSYRVIEKSTGQVLVSQDGTAFTFGAEFYPAADAAHLVKSEDNIKADLHLDLAGRDRLPDGSPNLAHVRFMFVRPEVLQVHITYEQATPSEISEAFNDQGEHYYGVWEYPYGGHIDNRGADAAFQGLGNARYVHHASARAPFYVTSRKYGIYVESLALGHYAIAQAGKTVFAFKEGQLKYDIIYGPSYAEVLDRYNEMAGPAFMPPTWAFGTIWWRDDEHDDLRDVHNAQEKVIDDADHLQKLKIPAGAIWLDRPYGSGELGWGGMDFDSSFPDPPRMLRELNERGVKLLLWSANRCSGKMFEEGSARGYLFPYKWPAADIRRPEVYNWWKEKLNAYVRLGVKGYKIDRGEESEMPDALENQFAVLFPKLSGEGLSQAYGNDYFIFTRNVNDISRRSTAVWNGDSWSTFGGLQVTIQNGLRAGIINFPMWGSDTGGYFAPSHNTKELLARWLEFSAFSPMMEVILGPKRTIWYDYDDELVAIAQKYASLHHDLIPYTRSYMYQATQTGMPIMRALAFAYPDDTTLSDAWDEYLYGAEILVAPVVTAGATDRMVYLPTGRWIDYGDKHTVYEGKAAIMATAPLGIIPLFVREGAIIPRGDIVKLNNNWDADWKPKLRVEIFPARTQRSEYSYFTGSGAQTISVARDGGGITIEFGELSVTGSLEVYCRTATEVRRNGTTLRKGTEYQYDPQSQMLTIPFQGATKLSIRGAESLF